MILKPPLRETLRWVGEVMREATDDWWVIASAAAALYGVDRPEVGDVDVLASESNTIAVLGRQGVSPLEMAPHPVFRSRVFGRLDTAPMTIEIMAGFCFRTEAGWQPVAPLSREKIDLDGVALFIPSREELAGILTDFGRPKDLERALQLTTQ